MQNKLISIIVPIHNTNLIYVEECISSIETQTYQKFELIIVNDASTNEELIFYFKNKLNKKHKLINLQTNIGLGPARNVGFNLAKGEIILYVDADDLLKPNALNDINEIFLKYPSIDFYWFEFKRLINNVEKNESSYSFNTNEVNINNFHNSLIITKMAWQKAYNKTFLLKNKIHFIEKNIYSEDTYYNLVCLSKAKNFVFKNTYNYLYRYVQNSLSNTTNLTKRANDLLLNVMQAYEFIKNDNNFLSNNFKKIFNLIFWQEANNYLRNNTSLQSKEIILKAKNFQDNIK